jgi:hypothetical protein
VGLDLGRQPFMSCRGGGRGRSRPPAANQISEAICCHHAVATLVEAAHRQSDLRGRLLPPHAARDPTATARVTAVVEAASRISEATYCHRARPDRRRVVVEAARRGMVAGARLGGGVNTGPQPPSYSSSSSYRPPWSTTTSSFSSTAPCGSTTATATGRWPQQQHG